MILSSNDQFRNMTPAQKSFVLSMLVNKVFQNPKNYGLSEDGVLKIGDKLDFTKLFEDTEEIKSIFDKARATIISGSPQEKTILENQSKISDWVKANPDAVLNEGKVSEILSAKPKPEIIPEKVEVVPAPIPKILDAQKEQMHQEISDAKQRISELENGKKNPNLERSLASDSRSYSLDADMNKSIDEAFKAEIDGIYGSAGVMGLGKVVGINSKEWVEMARLPALKIVEYRTGDSAKSGLPALITEKLSKSKNHQALMNQMVGLIEQTDGAVKPFENENVEQFVRRLGGYVMTHHHE